MNNVLKRALSSGVRDVLITCMLMGVWQEENKLKELLKNLAELSPGSANNVSNYPLSCCVVTFGTGDRVGAKAMLAALDLKEPIELLMAAILDLLIILADQQTSKEDDKNSFDIWSEQNLHRISEWMTGEFTPYFYGVILGSVLLVHKIAADLGSHYEQSWLFIINEAEKRLAADPAIGGTLAHGLRSSFQGL